MAKQLSERSKLEVFQYQAELCKALSDPKRLRIIHALRDEPKSVGQLAKLVGLKQSNTSQHLAVLRKAGVVLPHREQTTIYYSLVNPKIAEACDLVRSVIVEQIRKSQLLTGSE